MATIGSITIAFAADLKGLSEGIEDSLDLFDDLKEGIESLSEELDTLSEKSVTVKAVADTSAVARARSEINGLTGTDATVAVRADTDQAEQGLSRITAASARFAEIVETRVDRGLDTVSGAAGEVSSATGQAASAISGISQAISASTDGYTTAENAIDRVIVAVGRSRDAYLSTGAAVAAAAQTVGGFGFVTAAAAGSTVAAALSVASLSSAAAGAAAATGTYAAVMAATRFATAGLSEEAQRYVDVAASVTATTAATTVGVLASRAAYEIVRNAILTSGTAGQFLVNVFGGVGTAAVQAGARVGGLANRFGTLLAAIQIVSAAGSEEMNLAGFAALTARVVLTSAAFGALGSAVTAFTTGSATVMAGAIGGAISSVTALASAIPLVAPVAIAAAVATGKFAHELEHMSLAAQATDQMASRFGSSQEEMSKLRLAAQNTNVSMGQLAKGQQAFYTNLNKVKIGQLNVDSVREAKLAYDRLGISVGELKELSPEEAFKKVAKELSEVEDPAKRTALAFDLFGKQGAAILPALKEVGELEADFQRLGGALTKIDFQRFLTLETSFDRIKAASANLGQTLLIPFVELQKAFNNISADLQGGLTAALTPIMGILADMTKPIAVVIELFGRVLNIILRLAGVVGTVVAGFLDFAMIADLVAAVGDAFTYMLSYVESAVSVLEKIASVIASLLRPSITSLSESIYGFGKTFGEVVIGAIVSLALFNLAMQSTAVQAAVNAAIAYAAIGAGLFGVIIASIPVVVGYMAFYAASWITTAATSLASGITIHAAWLMAMGPIGLVIAGVELVVVGFLALYAACGGLDDILSVIGSALYYIGEATGVVAVINLISAAFSSIYAVGSKIYGVFASVGEALGFGGASEKIDAATASTEELAAAAEKAGKSSKQLAAEKVSEFAASGTAVQVDFGGAESAQVNFEEARAASVQFGMSMGLTAEQAEQAIGAIEQTTEGLRSAIATVSAEYAESLKGPSREEITASIDAARGAMGDLVIESARFGEAGADAATKATEDFNALQQKLADGTVTLEEFDSESKKLSSDLESNLKTLRDDSPQITLKKNLELYKKLDDAVKEAGKSVRDIAAGTVIDGKLFPASATVKANAELYKNEYAAALDAIKKKQQSGGFAGELKAKRENLEADFSSGKISQQEYATAKLNLDTTSAQEQASIAGEEAKREFDRKFKKLGEDVSFADNIRKELETAFLSPVQKFEKELKKIKDNPALTEMEKKSAEVNLRKQATESLVGKTEQTKFQERGRDVRQAAESGLISTDRMNAELKKASDSFASAVGVTKTPFETFSSSLDNIAEQFGFVGQPIDVVREKLKGNAEQLAIFDRAVKESRDNLLASLGIEKSPQQVFEEQMKKIGEAENSKDPNKSITKEQADQARAVATRKRDSELGAGEDMAGQLRERQAKINEAYGGGKDPAKLAVAQNKLDIDKRSAAGLDATPKQALQAGIDKINDAFGEAGKGTAEYNEAIKKNSDAVKASLGVERTGADKIAESRTKLAQAVKDGVITETEKNKALKKQRDDLLSSLGIQKTPSQDFEDAVERIKENAAELSPGEIAKGLKEAKDKLLSSLGIDKSPAQQATESMTKLREAFDKGQISAEEFAKGSQKAKDALLQSLGIPLDPVTQLKERLGDLDEAFSKGLISTEEFARGQEEAKRSMLPGGEAESPVKKFQRDMASIEKAASEGLIDEGELADRKKNLQAQLQEDLKPALDSTKADRRGVEATDARSKGGVDTFFRILRGNDNPSLKAQLEVARNTKILAEAAKEPKAAPAIAQLSPGR